MSKLAEVSDDALLADDPRFAKYGDLPRHLRGGLIRYVDHGILPGSFLQAVISNDLREACARADDASRPMLWAIVQWLHWEAPGGSWGSREALVSWVQWRHANAKGERNGDPR